MQRVLASLGACLCLIMVQPALAQDAKPKDVPESHWAYSAMVSLQQKGILTGYPDGMFRGGKTISRYEFAVALARALDKFKAEPGAPGAPGRDGGPGPQGPRGARGPAGTPPEVVTTLKKLIGEFAADLRRLGNTYAGLNRRIDEITNQVNAINKKLDDRPEITANAFLGIQGVNGHGNDQDGRLIQGRDRQTVLHDFTVGIKAPIKVPGMRSASGGTDVASMGAAGAGAAGSKAAVLDAAINSTNFLRTFNDSIGTVSPQVNNPTGDTYIHHLTVTTPLDGVGRDGTFKIGRQTIMDKGFGFRSVPVSSYFHDPNYDGHAFFDGVRVKSSFGSVGVDVAAGLLDSVQGSNSGLLGPVGGVSTNGRPVAFIGGTPKFYTGNNGFTDNANPSGQVDQGQGVVTRMVRANVSLPVGHLLRGGSLNVGASDAAVAGAVGFTSLLTLTGDASADLSSNLKWSANYGKSITETRRDKTVNPHNNEAVKTKIGYSNPKWNASLGYTYIEPDFSAPGYWGRIGNWINPNNIHGPELGWKYNVSSTTALNSSWAYYKAVMDRSGGTNIGPNVGSSFGRNDWLLDIKAGSSFKASERVNFNVNWEGVRERVVGFHQGAHNLGSGSTHNSYNLITFGTGLHLTQKTILGMSYQIVNYNGMGAITNGGDLKSSGGIFTTQLSTKF